MRKYQRVAYQDRCHIFAWMQDKVSISEIASRLGFHKSTVYRELRRNKGAYAYSPGLAQGYAKSRYFSCRKRYKLDLTLRSFVESKILSGWSPEQISGRLRVEKKIKISHECIYQYLRKNKRYFKPYMRRFKKTGGSRYTQRRSPHSESLLKIKSRPEIVNKRGRIGDWERDCMYGLNKKTILVMTDRKSRYTKLKKTSGLVAAEINELTKNLIISTNKKAFTVTNDRGTEFAIPLEKIKTYYCDPYTPTQRGTIENTIGLIRQYIKNNTDIDQMGDIEIKEVETKLNLRPRKCLKYKTPYEVFFKTKVALAS